MNCPKCGFWNPPEKQFCHKCGEPMPLLVLDEPDPPAPAPDAPDPDAPKSPRPKIKSEVLRLFDPDAQRTRKGPGGTKLIRRPRRPADEQPGAVPGDSAGPAEPPATRPPGVRGDADDQGGTSKRRGRTSRRLTLCSVCEAPFAARELVELRGKRYCDPCLERRASLFDAEELGEARRAKAKRIAASREREAEMRDPVPPPRPTAPVPRPVGAVTEIVTRTTSAHRRCARHPEHSGSDRCEQCGAAMCALCIQRVATRVLCPGCRSGAAAAVVSGRFEGFGGGGLETTRDVVMNTHAFYRSLPAGGGLVRPFLYAMLAAFVGSSGVFIAIAVWAGGTIEGNPLAILLARPTSLLLAALLCGVTLPALSAAVHLIHGGIAGSRTTRWHTMRGAFLSLSPAWMVLIPGLGLVLWPCWWWYVQVVMARSVQGSGWFGAATASAINTLLAGGVIWGLGVLVAT